MKYCHILLWYAIAQCFCEDLVRRYKADSQSVINVFPNTHNLCNRGYCEDHNAVCSGYSCCYCRCMISQYFLSQSAGCLRFEEIKEKLTTEMKFPKKDIATLITTGANLNTIPILSSKDKINEMELPLHLFVTKGVNDVVCNGSTIYYIADNGNVAVYNNNQCEDIIGVHRNGDNLRLKWNSDLESQWTGLEGWIVLFKINCLLMTSRLQARRNALMVFQVSGQHEAGIKPAEAEIGLALKKVCDRRKNTTSFGNVTFMEDADKRADKREDKEIDVMLLGIIVGFVVVVILAIIVGVMIYYLATKNMLNLKRHKGPSGGNNTAKEENEYVEPPTIGHGSAVEDANGYLLPTEWTGGVPSPSPPPTTTSITRAAATSLDENGYVSLHQLHTKC